MKDIFTVQELAEYLKMHPKTLQRKAKKGDIPAIKINRQYRFDKEQIDRWLSQRAVVRPLHILIVDDDPAIGLLFKQNLEKLGHKVTVSTNGIEAMELLDRKRFELIFLDLIMPVIDGSELLFRIRDIDKHVTITIMTDEVDTDRLKKAMKEGPILLMHKPLDDDDVLEALRKFNLSLDTKS